MQVWPQLLTLPSFAHLRNKAQHPFRLLAPGLLFCCSALDFVLVELTGFADLLAFWQTNDLQFPGLMPFPVFMGHVLPIHCSVKQKNLHFRLATQRSKHLDIVRFLIGSPIMFLPKQVLVSFTKYSINFALYVPLGPLSGFKLFPKRSEIPHFQENKKDKKNIISYK